MTAPADSVISVDKVIGLHVPYQPSLGPVDLFFGDGAPTPSSEARNGSG